MVPVHCNVVCMVGCRYACGQRQMSARHVGPHPGLHLHACCNGTCIPCLCVGRYCGTTCSHAHWTAGHKHKRQREAALLWPRHGGAALMAAGCSQLLWNVHGSDVTSLSSNQIELCITVNEDEKYDAVKL